MNKEKMPSLYKVKKLTFNFVRMFFATLLAICSFYITYGTVNATNLSCYIAIDFDNDGDIDGSDLQRFAEELEVGGAGSEQVREFADLFGINNVDVALAKLQPTLALMVATGPGKLEIAWTAGTDGTTPADEVTYYIHLGISEDYIPDASTLKKTITGVNQTEINGLESDTLYYGKLIAVYNSMTSCSSNTLQSKTYQYPVQEDNSTVVSNATDLGLGTHTTTDGITYTYSNGTPPAVGSVLFSEDSGGGMTLRTVDSVTSSADIITVVTSHASLTDVLDRASIYSSFQLFDVEEEAKGLPSSTKNIATAKQIALKDGSRYSRIAWDNKLLSAEQITYAYEEDAFSVQLQEKSSLIKLMDSKAVSSEFEATVTAEFKPDLITHAEWGGFIVKHLESAQVGAKGVLSLTALAQYKFSDEGDVEEGFELWSRTWHAVYQAGPMPVYQEITLTMNVEVTAHAEAEIKATAEANLAETVEVGATYDGSTWTPYIIHNESKSLTASLDIKGGAHAEIRLIPKIEVKFYKVSSASLTVEPFIGSELTFADTTDNWDFLTAHPEHAMQLTSFTSSLGMEANVTAYLSALGYHWDVLPLTCVLGSGSCLYTFNELELFSIPELELSTTSSTETQTDLELQVTDGTFNSFSQGSVNWEVFPDDATITPGSCSKSGQATICTAVFTPGVEDEYTVFASGYGRLGEVGRQFKDMMIKKDDTLTGTWTGTYSWDCDGRTGSTDIRFELLQERGSPGLSGTAYYLGSSTQIALHSFRCSNPTWGPYAMTGCTPDTDGNFVNISTIGNSQIAYNKFQGEITNENSTIIGITLNGDSDGGCSACYTTSGVFEIVKQ